MGIVNMKTTDYYLSGEHTENYKLALEKAKIKNKENRLTRIEEYNKNPILCKLCSMPIPYDKSGTNVFCNRSCSGTFNNTRRVHTEETKQKQSMKSKGRKRSQETQDKWKIIHAAKKKPDHELVCKNCNKVFTQPRSKNKRKTCSRECSIMCSVGNRSYQNGSRKPVKYYNKWQQEYVILDSSWEIIVAKHLDELCVMWTRPSPLKWVDMDNIDRLYYPDFYIPTLNVYLDPKNPFCMKRDEYKMKMVSNDVELIYGSLETIMSYVKSLMKIMTVNFQY